MVIRRVIDYAIRTTGAKLLSEGYKAFRKYDVRVTNQLFGKSGGKGFRHGRDLGLILGEYVGDDVDDYAVPPYEPVPPSRQVSKTRSGYKRGSDRRNSKYNRCYNYSRRPGRNYRRT